MREGVEEGAPGKLFELIWAKARESRFRGAEERIFKSRMIDHIEFCDAHHSLVIGPDRVFHFAKGYNCVIGPTGAGKTALLGAIKGCKQCTVVSSQAGKIYHYSTERNDIRRLNRDISKLSAEAQAKSKAFRTLSHGEGNALLFGAGWNALALKAGDTLLVDEPEAGLDLDAAYEVAGSLSHLCTKGVQVIVATHHPVFVSATGTTHDKIIALSPKPEEDVEAYLSEWEEAVENLREILEIGESNEESVDERSAVLGAARSSRSSS